MDDLITWLRAQLDEEERVARAARPGNWIAGRTTEPDWGPIRNGQIGDVYFVDGERWPKVRTVEGTHVCVNGPGGGMVAQVDRTAYRRANCEHIARHDPARVLAEVEAKRRILDLHYIIWRDIGWLERDEGEIVEGYAELPVCGHCVPRHSSFPTRQDVPEGPCLTVRLLAQPYADRPGYREEWRP